MKSKSKSVAQELGHGAGQTLFAFVRHWSRRWHTSDTRLVKDNARHVLAVEAVHALAKRSAATINSVASEIGIDQSGASRLVKEAAEAGYLTLNSSNSDARQKEVALTLTGYDLLHHAHSWQEEVFRHLTESWTDQERQELHRAMLRLLDRSHIIRS